MTLIISQKKVIIEVIRSIARKKKERKFKGKEVEGKEKKGKSCDLKGKKRKKLMFMKNNFLQKIIRGLIFKI